MSDQLKELARAVNGDDEARRRWISIFNGADAEAMRIDALAHFIGRVDELRASTAPASAIAAVDRLERAAMAYERLGKVTRDDEKSRQMRKDAMAELAAARTAILAALSQPEAAQAGEAIKGGAAYDAYMQWANGDEENTVFAELRTVLPSLNDIQAGQVVIAVARALANLPTPSREEVPTDEQVERFVAVYEKACPHRYDRDAIRAALKAAGPSAQQRVSEEMVERARKNLAASGIWVSAHGVMQVLDAALSPENGGA